VSVSHCVLVFVLALVGQRLPELCVIVGCLSRRLTVSEAVRLLAAIRRPQSRGKR